MARRPDAERLYQARRATLTARLINQAGLSPESAEMWVIAWEDEAELRGRSGWSVSFWDGAWGWIEKQRAAS
jgi:hypothetical protein